MWPANALSRGISADSNDLAPALSENLLLDLDGEASPLPYALYLELGDGLNTATAPCSRLYADEDNWTSALSYALYVELDDVTNLAATAPRCDLYADMDGCACVLSRGLYVELEYVVDSVTAPRTGRYADPDRVNALSSDLSADIGY